ncbi:Zinc-type alcohol dehydrogenase [Penicillium ucsense]|uniref:Zinc-type alcohol dehydrogenase n=1 Tax=Penicillium ucsense TaxID=2839758 RepID=A0A8J8WAF5_9EURO|nr:Zinc-type alcohol dehydrogenase [Penicillium ucsense]KAF7735266.1 Zinc-type alcohol dehydrogenase [Penicillium ucsense]
MSEPPSIQVAIVTLDDGTLGLCDHVQVPTLEEDMIIVKNHVVALNPIDTKMVGKLATPGAIAGMDFAGEVISIGSNVQTATPIKPGGRVCGAVPGMHALTPAVGGFAQYVGAADLTTLKIPEHMSLEEAVTLGSGIGTIGLALFKSLDVPGSPKSPAATPMDVLVYGGSTATGTLAIQLLKLSGFNPITTCSPKNFELVRSFGATQVFDYHQDTVTDDIRVYTRKSLKNVLDCYTALEPYPDFLHTRPQTIQDLLDDGQLKSHPHEIIGDDLGGILQGLAMLKEKRVSGKKLVCRV